jgi:hypothetical protein
MTHQYSLEKRRPWELRAARARTETQIKICERFEERSRQLDIDLPSRTTILITLDFVDAQIDIDLDQLLAFPNSDFMHDMIGMLTHVSRVDGKLGDGFSPRCEINQEFL